MKRLLLAAAFIVAATPVRADPIFTPILVAALTSLGASATVASVVAPIIVGVVTLAVGLGLAALFRTTPPKPENGTFPVQQPIPFRIYGYGTARVPGAVVLKESGDFNNFANINVLNGHLIDSFVGVYLNDDLVNVGITNGLIEGWVQPGADGRYGRGKYNPSGSVYLSSRRGLVPETFNGIVNGVCARIWPQTCRGDGCASIGMFCTNVKQSDFTRFFPYQAPQPSPILNQYRLFDPRDATQSPSNPASFKFSRNAALAILHFQCFSDYGPRRVYVTAILPVLDFWIAAANDCDAQVGLKAGGTEARYLLGGWTTAEQDRRSTLQAMLAACDGHFVERGDGTIILRCGVYRAPTVTLTDDDILGFMIQRDVASDERINRATAKYTDPSNAYITVETVPMNDFADQQVRPGPIRSSQLDVTWVQSVGQASRLLKREMIRSSEKTRGTLTINLSGLNACYERWVLVQSNSIPRLNGTVIEIKKPTISLATMSVEIEFVGSGPQIDVYDPATDESPPQPIAPRILVAGPPIPQNVSVVAEQSGSSVYLAVSWDAPVDGSGAVVAALSYQLSYSVVQDDGSDGPPTEQTFTDPTIAGGRVMVNSSAVPTGLKLDVTVMSIASADTLSTASIPKRVDTSLTAPGMPINLAANGRSYTAALSCTNPSSSNFASVRFYRALSGAGFTNASAIGQPIYGQPGATSTYTDTVNPGVYDYYATATSTGNVESAPTGPAPATVTT